jgi:hypothetical protein
MSRVLKAVAQQLLGVPYCPGRELALGGNELLALDLPFGNEVLALAHEPGERSDALGATRSHPNAQTHLSARL